MKWRTNLVRKNLPFPWLHPLRTAPFYLAKKPRTFTPPRLQPRRHDLASTPVPPRPPRISIHTRVGVATTAPPLRGVVTSPPHRAAVTSPLLTPRCHRLRPSSLPAVPLPALLSSRCHQSILPLPLAIPLPIAPRRCRGLRRRQSRSASPHRGDVA
jgi:hypothetical protein